MLEKLVQVSGNPFQSGFEPVHLSPRDVLLQNIDDQDHPQQDTRGSTSNVVLDLSGLFRLRGPQPGSDVFGDVGLMPFLSFQDHLLTYCNVDLRVMPTREQDSETGLLL